MTDSQSQQSQQSPSQSQARSIPPQADEEVGDSAYHRYEADPDSDATEMSVDDLLADQAPRRFGPDGELREKRKNDVQSSTKRKNTDPATAYDLSDEESRRFSMTLEGPNIDHSVPSSQEERFASALAHGLPLILLLLTGGAALPLALIPTAILYLYYNERSEFISRNALEALKAQFWGTWGLAIFWVLWALGVVPLVLFIVTIPLLCAWIPLGAIAGVLLTIGLPLALILFGAYGAFQSLQGNTYRYPWPRIRNWQRIRAMPWNW
jgi:uncharacterized Tic20 family protein